MAYSALIHSYTLAYGRCAKSAKMGQFMQIIVNAWLGELLVKIGAATELKESPKEEPKPVPTVPPRSEPVKKIFCDPGHAESKAGARSNDGTAQEEDLNRLQAAIIKRELEATGRFLCTVFDPAIEDLVEIGKAAKGHDMSIHLHHNKYSGSEDPGTEVLFDNDKAESQSKELARRMSATIAKALGTKDRGAKPFAGTVMDYAEQQGDFPVVLTESYFLNPYTKAQAEERSIKAAIAIADTVKQWF